MAGETRARRLGKRMREELAELIDREVADPRLDTITVTDVEVDRELAYATVFVTALDADERMDEILQALEGARGFLRSQLAARIPLRSFPQLRFRHDSSPQHGSRIDDLLEQLRKSEEQDRSETGEA
ncbi:MAG: 30S ribosome-binding factor RbfA [Anaerolineales bacterium]